MSVAVLAAACSGLPARPPSELHLRPAAEATKAAQAAIPAPVSARPTLPPPKAAAKTETYSVSVRNVPAQELLFALARDAKLNIDLHPGISGTVTINAIDQTLQQILNRIAKQVDMRWETDGPNLIVMPDSPFLRNYRVDYVNMSRDVKVNTEVNSQVSAGAGSQQGNQSSGALTRIESTSKNAFWKTLEENVKDILRETDKILPEGSSETFIESSGAQTVAGAAQPQNARSGQPRANQPAAADGNTTSNAATTVKRVTFREAASVIMNAETGIVAVRATARQHEKVQEYLDLVSGNARRQVMIEATIVEVTLGNTFEQGIKWEGIRTLRKGKGTQGVLTALENPDGPTLATTGQAFLLNYVSPGAGIDATLKLLEDYGDVRVLSSPKISVLNNQTAVIKVVDNVVYFTVKADTTTSSAGSGQTTVTTTPNSVAVGLVMSVTPQISESNTVLLNVRPTISRLKGAGKRDPNPNIPVDIPNIVPEIQTREMESMLRLTDGEIAVMGGLMSDEQNRTTGGVPGLSSIPGVGRLFEQRNDTSKKTELVIFLKPTVIRDPSLDGDYARFAKQLPRGDFFPADKPVGTSAGAGTP